MFIEEINVAKEDLLTVKELSEYVATESNLDVKSAVELCRVVSSELPIELRKKLAKLKAGEVEAVVLRGVLSPIINKNLETPKALIQNRKQTTDLIEVGFLLLASSVGFPFGWQSIQHGSVVNDVFPIREHKALPRSSGYTNNFLMHTEDAFHEYCEQFFGLLCMSNSEEIPTVLASVGDVNLTPEVLSKLREPIYKIMPNIAHDSGIARAKEARPVIFGDPKYPYFAINFNNIERESLDKIADEALESLNNELILNGVDINLSQGDILIVDNYRVAHGRKRYTPSSSNSRWLKRLYITSDLRFLSRTGYDTDTLMAKAT